MNQLDTIKEFVKNNPGSTWWVEELLFRGEPNKEHGGILKGAHVILGIKSTGPNGQDLITMTHPLPVSSLPGDIPVMEVLSTLHLATHRKNDEQQELIMGQNKLIAELSLTRMQRKPNPTPR